MEPGIRTGGVIQVWQKTKICRPGMHSQDGSETPRRTGVLIKSAALGTVIGSGEINQITPYARRQYYEHKEKSRWFERMKNRHKDSILKGAEKIE